MEWIPRHEYFFASFQTLPAILRNVFPNETIEKWRFVTNRNHWRKIKSRRAALDTFERNVNIEKPEDWYDVTAQAVLRFGAEGLLEFYEKSFHARLKSLRPSFK